MDGQNPQVQAPPPHGNRPPPPPPRTPQGMGASTQQPSIGSAATVTPATPPIPAPAPPFPAQQPQYPQQAPQQSQTGYSYPQAGQYYAYPPARTGVPLWAWLTGGAALLVIIVVAITLILVLGGNKTNGGATGGGGAGGGGGGTGGGNSPTEAVVSFWSNMIQHNYDAANLSLAPGNAMSTGQLRQLMEQNEQNNQTTYKSVTSGTENIAGDTATVPLEMQTASGRTADLTPSVTKVGGKWFVADPGFPNLPAQP